MQVRIVLLGVLVSMTLASYAQGPELPQYNPNSINPIPRYEHLYKVRVWRQIDLQEKMNEGFFSHNGEINKLIINAIKSGEISEVYKYDSLTTVLPKTEFLGMLQMSQATTYDPWDPAADYYQGDIKSFNGKNYEAKVDNKGKNPETSPDDWGLTKQGSGAEYLPGDVSILRIMEDVIFDKRRSRLYYDVQAVQMVVPGSKTTTTIDNELGWVKYKDLERVFRNHPVEAVWFNRYNTAENKNFADAFLLRLFHAVIYKVENPDDSKISDIYAENNRPYKESVWAREWEEMRLMEKEHNLWEY